MKHIHQISLIKSIALLMKNNINLVFDESLIMKQ